MLPLKFKLRVDLLAVVDRALLGLLFLPHPPPPLPLAVPLALLGLPWSCGPLPRPDVLELPVLIVDPITELLMVVQLPEVVGCPPCLYSVVGGEENLSIPYQGDGCLAGRGFLPL